MILLVLNCGSATVKYELFEERAEGLRSVATGTAEVDAEGYGPALERIVRSLPGRPDAIAHRVVHGGVRFREPVVIDEVVEEEIRRLVPLAPLHNAPALEGFQAARPLGVPMVAVFDTAFHQTMPEAAWRYALPASAPPEVRRYGFHGSSHQFVAERYAALAGSPAPTLITLHLGNGCSACAVKQGRSVETSMGMSPLEGLVMGTRAGDLDPGVLLHLLRGGMTPGGLEEMLQHRSGLAGLAGTNDMRAILSRSDPEARRAVDIFCHRVRKYVGAYLAVLGGAEAVVFTGGIGENAPAIRSRICSGMEWAGLRLDESRNARGEGRISSDASRLHAWVIRTDEELLIARQAIDCLRSAS